MVSLFRHTLPVVLFLLSACGGPPKPKTEASAGPPPLTVLVDQTISGRIQGQILRSPSGLAVDRQGTIYLVDAGNNRIIRFSRDLQPVRDFGGYGAADGLFNRPEYISVDNDLNLMVSDLGNRRISRIDSRLNFVSSIPLEDDNDPFKFGEPSGVALGSYGAVWWGDRTNDRVVVMDNVEQFDRFIGDYGYAGGQLRSPEKIVAGPDGKFYVCDAGNSRIVVYDQYGNFERQIINPELRYPSALTFDEHGRMWALDSDQAKVLCLDSRGKTLLSVGPMLPGAQEKLKDPFDLAFTYDGRLLISDKGNNRLVVCRVAYETP